MFSQQTNNQSIKYSEEHKKKKHLFLLFFVCTNIFTKLLPTIKMLTQSLQTVICIHIYLAHIEKHETDAQPIPFRTKWYKDKKQSCFYNFFILCVKTKKKLTITKADNKQTKETIDKN